MNELADVADRLDTHVSGKTLADAARATRLAQREMWADHVGTYFRHIESFISIEGHRDASPHAADALALHKAAFPGGLNATSQAYISEQHVHYRATLKVLRASEHAATITAIGLPVAWIDSFEASLKASEAAQEEVTEARTEKSVHVGLGRDVEEDWVDTMRRLQKQVASRSRRGGALKEAEGAKLLEPLLVTIKKMQAEQAARVTRKHKKGTSTEQAAKEPQQPGKDTQQAGKDSQQAGKDTQQAGKDTQQAEKDTQQAEKDTQQAGKEAAPPRTSTEEIDSPALTS